MCVPILFCFTVSKPAIKCIFTPFANHQLCWRQYGSTWLGEVANVSSSILCSHCHPNHYHSHHHQPLQRNNTAFARTINNSPQTIPLYLHTASNCNHHYWSGICYNFSPVTDIWAVKAAERNAWDANITVFTSTWALSTAKIHSKNMSRSAVSW